MTSEGYLVFQWKITDIFSNFFYFHSLKKNFFFLYNFKDKHAQILKLRKSKRGNRGQDYPEFLPGISMVAFEDMPFQNFLSVHTQMYISQKCFHTVHLAACFFHLAGQYVFSSILIFFCNMILSGCLISPSYRCGVIYLTNSLSLDS